MQLSQVNLVVADLEVSHDFYTSLGWTMRPITTPDNQEPQAWKTTAGPAPVTLHSQTFAQWWDPSAVHPAPGAVTLDLTFDHHEQVVAFVENATELGATVIAELRPMPWGQNYGILADPDGYQWGLRSPL